MIFFSSLAHQGQSQMCTREVGHLKMITTYAFLGWYMNPWVYILYHRNTVIPAFHSHVTQLFSLKTNYSFTKTNGLCAVCLSFVQVHIVLFLFQFNIAVNLLFVHLQYNSCDREYKYR